jgi:hypothetical protein
MFGTALTGLTKLLCTKLFSLITEAVNKNFLSVFVGNTAMNDFSSILSPEDLSEYPAF